MGDRATIALHLIDDFAKFCEGRGWTRQPTKGEWEVLRMRHPKFRSPMLLYTRAGYEDKPPQHATIGWDQSRAVKQMYHQFARERRRNRSRNSEDAA